MRRFITKNGANNDGKSDPTISDKPLFSIRHGFQADNPNYKIVEDSSNSSADNNQQNNNHNNKTGKKKCGCQCCEKKGLKVYVKAGFVMGNGTQERPYGTLALAQADFTWKTLVVYYSNLPLDGGIVLKDGQRIVGKGIYKPLITNTNMGTNGGIGVMVEDGSVCIQNVQIDATQSSAINYDNADNLSLYCVLVTQSNQAGLTVPVGNTFSTTGTFLFNNVEVGAIHGQNANNGTTKLVNVEVRDITTGPGIYDSPFNSAHRDLIVLNSEFTRLTTTASTATPNLFVASAGIVAEAYEPGTKHKVIIKNTYIHDFLPNTNIAAQAHGIRLAAINGAKGFYEIKENRISRIFPATPPFTTGLTADIYGLAVTFISDVGTFLSETEANIFCNKFTENNPGSNFNVTGAIGIVWDTFNGKSKTFIRKNTFTGNRFAIMSQVAAISDSKIIIKKNIASSFGPFYSISSQTSFSSDEVIDKIALNHKAVLCENIFNGSSTIGAIMAAPIVPFNTFTIELRKNCINGEYPTVGSNGLAAFETIGTAPSNVVYIAHENNITNYSYGVIDNANASYFLEKNWWGNPNGPAFNIGPATGVLDISNPLKRPIVCPIITSCDSDSEDDEDNQQNNNQRPLVRTNKSVTQRTQTPEGMENKVHMRETLTIFREMSGRFRQTGKIHRK
jgi:hypothetical protein